MQTHTIQNLPVQIYNVVKISGPKRSTKITAHFTSIAANVTYCITCTLCKKVYIGEMGRRLADHFREHLRDAEKDTNASKSVGRHFNLPNHSHYNLRAILTPREHREPQKFIFQFSRDQWIPMLLRPRPQVSGYFLIRNFFFPDTKISASTRYVMTAYSYRIRTSTRIRIHSGFAEDWQNCPTRYWFVQV